MFKPTMCACLLIAFGTLITTAEPAAASDKARIIKCIEHGVKWKCNCSEKPWMAVADSDSARDCCERKYERYLEDEATGGSAQRLGRGNITGRNPLGVKLGLEHLFFKDRLGFEFAGAYEGDDDIGGPQYLGTVGLNLHSNPDARIYDDETLDVKFGGFLAYVWPYEVRCDLAGADRPSVCAPGNFLRTELENKPAWGLALDFDFWIRRGWGWNVGARYLMRQRDDEDLVVIDRELLYGTFGVVFRY